MWNYENHPIECKLKGTKGKSLRLIVRMSIDGADQLVVALKGGNTPGAKGLGQCCLAHDQLIFEEEL